MNSRLKKYMNLYLIVLSLMFFTTASAQTLKIMPMGNSITYDDNSGDLLSPRDPEVRSSYRCQLYQLLFQAGYNFSFVGSENSGWNNISEGCSMPYFYSANAGFPGMKDQHLTRLLTDGYDERHSEQITWGPYFDYYLPDAILLHIGTNDITHGDAYEVDDLIAKINSECGRLGTTMVVFLAKIINRRIGASLRSTTTAFNLTHIQSIYNNRANYPNIEIILVDMENEAGIDYTNDMYDDLHPKIIGYSKMAQVWYNAITTRFPLSNDPPVIYDIPEQITNEGIDFSTLDLTEYVTDDADSPEDINWSMGTNSNVNLEFQLDGADLNVSVLDEDWFGDDSILVIAEDNGKNGLNIKSSSTYIKFFVNPVNDAPIILGQNTINIQEDKAFNVSFSDLIYSDVDNDSLNLSINLIDGENYSISDNMIIPDENFSGVLTVPIKILDLETNSNTYSLIVTVIEVEDPPTLLGDFNIVINEDSIIYWSNLKLDINDIDSPLENITYKFIVGENYNVLDDTVIVPESNYFGNLSIPILISDGQNINEDYNLYINVLPVNDLPFVTSSPNDEIAEGEQYTYIIDVEDIEEDEVSITSKKLPEWLDYFQTSSLLFGTAYSNNDYDTIILELNDGNGIAEYQFVIKINSTNTPPQVISEPVTSLSAGTFYSYKIEAIDNEGDTNLTYHINQKPSWLYFNTETTTLEGSCEDNVSGEFPIEIEVSDGKENSYQNFILNVGYYNTSPQIISIPNTEIEEEQVYSYKVIVSDPDLSDTIIYLEYFMPYWLTFDKEFGIITGIPDDKDIGQFWVEIGVSDLKDTLRQGFLLTSYGINDIPIITGQKSNIKVLKNTSFEISLDNLIVKDDDNSYPDDFNLSVYEGENYTKNNNIILPSVDYVGELNVPVTVSDGENTSNLEYISINVTLADNISEGNIQKSIANIYPIPTSTYLTIDLFQQKSTFVYFELVDISGRVLIQKKLNEKISQINVSGQSSGIYFVRLKAKNNVYTQKVFIK